MQPRSAARLANAFIATYALDALLSAADEVLRGATGATWVGVIRHVVAAVLANWAFFWLPLLALIARLPTGLLLTLSLVAAWLNLGAAPTALWIEAPGARAMTLSAVQLATAGLAFAWIRHRTGRFWFSASSLTGPAFSWAHTLRYTAGYLLVLLPAGFLYAGVALATWTELWTHRFLSFDLGGISLADRTYVRGDRELRLVAMMHLGDGRAYREIAASFVGDSTVVLAEGVTDTERRLETPPSVEGVAESLGLEAQDDLESYFEELGPAQRSLRPVVWHADVDVRDFSPVTVRWLDDMGRIWNADGTTAALREFMDRSLRGPEEIRTVERDILTRRNEHLLGQLAEALAEYRRVIVPWGALHQPAIEASILDDGFQMTDARRHRLVSWLAVAGALLGQSGDEATPAAETPPPPPR